MTATLTAPAPAPDTNAVPLPPYSPPARRRRLAAWADTMKPLRLPRPPSRLPGEDLVAYRIRSASLAYRQSRFGISNDFDTTID